MAIPFTVPSEDDGELPDLNLLLSNLSDAIVCLRRVHSQIQLISRVPSLSMRPTATARYEFDPVNTHSHINLALMSWRNERTDSVIAQAASARRSRRHRTCSESSCCDESKVDAVVTDNEPDIHVIDEPPAQDWTKEDNVLFGGGGKQSREIGSSESDSLFGKLVPSPMKSSIWTAVICVVGWYMFRAR